MYSNHDSSYLVTRTSLKPEIPGKSVSKVRVSDTAARDRDVTDDDDDDDDETDNSHSGDDERRTHACQNVHGIHGINTDTYRGVQDLTMPVRYQPAILLTVE